MRVQSKSISYERGRRRHTYGQHAVIALLASFAMFTFAAPVLAQRLQPGWGQPFPPFRIAGNLYYVGDQDLGSYLIATREGLILINSGIKEDVPLIHKDVEELGFRYSDIKILLTSHAHFDHVEGSALIMQEAGAKFYVMDADVSTIESGGRDDFQYGKDSWARFPAVKVDCVLHDGDKVELGGSVLVAHLTPGHTKGTTTWTMDVVDGAKTLHVVIVGSPNVNPGYQLVNNKQYPQIAEDYQRGFQVLKSLPCDIFLGAHGGYFGLKEKYARWKAGDKDAFIDPAGYKAYVEEREQAFEMALKRQQQGR
jgi:metallo-beta-lactamase class B